MRDFMWFVLCVALLTIIWKDNLYYRRQIEQIRFEANQAQRAVKRGMDQVEAQEAYLRMKKEELEVKTKQWQDRVGQRNTEPPR